MCSNIPEKKRERKNYTKEEIVRKRVGMNIIIYYDMCFPCYNSPRDGIQGTKKNIVMKKRIIAKRRENSCHKSLNMLWEKLYKNIQYKYDFKLAP